MKDLILKLQEKLTNLDENLYINTESFKDGIYEYTVTYEKASFGDFDPQELILFNISNIEDFELCFYYTIDEYEQCMQDEIKNIFNEFVLEVKGRQFATQFREQHDKKCEMTKIIEDENMKLDDEIVSLYNDIMNYDFAACMLYSDLAEINFNNNFFDLIIEFNRLTAIDKTTGIKIFCKNKQIDFIYYKDEITNFNSLNYLDKYRYINCKIKLIEELRKNKVKIQKEILIQTAPYLIKSFQVNRQLEQLINKIN